MCVDVVAYNLTMRWYMCEGFFSMAVLVFIFKNTVRLDLESVFPWNGTRSNLMKKRK